MIMTLEFEDFVRLVNNLGLQLYYLESDSDFHIFALLSSHVVQTRINFDEITSGVEHGEYALEAFRQQYLRHAFKPIDTDLKLPKPSTLPSTFEKLQSTSSGGEGTPGTALIPVNIGTIGGKFRCTGCGYFGPKGGKCPKCGGKMEEVKEAFTDLKKFVGWDFEGTVKWILEFLKDYTFPLITEITKKQRKKIKDVIIDSLMEGWSIPKVENEIYNIVDDKEKAERIARTEIIKVTNEGALLHYETKGIKKVRWIATPCGPHGRTCQACLDMNGKEFNIEDAKGRIPLHPQCRCCWSAIID